ncbi:hypothetical protein Fmac_018145 [Flemingia macrophylla]|uniref:Uncharacterized protein n=1 Tax=Flemingia macrophylla TaxID=520843 RepID=A0ABD1M457_9FABA
MQAAREAQRSTKLNSERITVLSNEIAAMKASLEHLKLTSEQSQEEGEAQLVGYFKTTKEEARKNLEFLKKEYDPKLTQSLDTNLAETTAEIEILQQQIKNCMFPRWMLKHLKQVQKEQGEVKKKKHVAEALAANLTSELQNSREESRPEPFTTEDLEVYIFYVKSVKIQKLQLETKGARREAEEMKRKAQELKQEAERARVVAEEAEKKFELVLVEAKDAKVAEQRVVKEINLLFEVGRVPNSKFSGTIKMSNEDFEAMRAKAKECEDLVEKKEAMVMAELQQIYARKNEVDRKVETNLKEIEETKATIETNFWSAKMADSAKAAIESELRRYRQQQQKLVPGTAS